MSNGDRKTGVPTTVTSIPLVDPNAIPANPSIGDRRILVIVTPLSVATSFRISWPISTWY